VTSLLDVAFRVIRPADLEWTTRPHEPEEAPRHVAELSALASFAHSRANVWRYEPGAKGRRHKHVLQEETFIVLSGTLSMYLGDPPERHDVPTGGLIHVEPGTPLQTANHDDEDLLVYAYGFPPEHEHAELLDPAI
jgi:quercetin dioxygenase-like cupin family protein